METWGPEETPTLQRPRAGAWWV
ncbi:hypothetical protein EYF80_064177 [Liparis tanakae]|uniref:Uncharacterized protein n=1 Tax=Liparis tanakae TaxID=230148 RepID=A0A4Z2EAF0_9TELE|nr:hypothetical protein EYF80_064177 [Liparis tanakae]